MMQCLYAFFVQQYDQWAVDSFATVQMYISFSQGHDHACEKSKRLLGGYILPTMEGGGGQNWEQYGKMTYALFFTTCCAVVHTDSPTWMIRIP